MKSHRWHFLQFFLLINLFWGSLLAFADSIPYKNAVLLASTNGGCASGIILNDGHIITNAHVTESLCPFKDCSNVSILFSEKVGERARNVIPCEKLSVENSRYSADVSSLKCEGVDFRNFPTLNITPEQGKSSITIVGYPGCKELKVSEGLVTQESLFHFTSSAKGSYGSSGSGVYNKNGYLVGVIDQAKSFRDLSTSLFGILDFELRGVDSREIQALLLKDFSDAALKSQVLNLLSFYRSSVRTKIGFERLFASFDFTARIDWLSREYLERADTRGLPLVALGDYFSVFKTIENSFLSPLIAAYMIESRGLNYAPWEKLKDKDQEIILNEINPAGKKELEELFAEEKKSPYKGAEITLLMYGVYLLFFAFISGTIIYIFVRWIFRRRNA